MQRIILGLEGVEAVVLVDQKAEQPVVGIFRDEDMADPQLSGNIRTADERTTSHLLEVIDLKIVVDNEITVVIVLAGRGIAGDDARGECEALVLHHTGEGIALGPVGGIGRHVHELDPILRDAGTRPWGI